MSESGWRNDIVRTAPRRGASPRTNARAAASYLDGRMSRWLEWPSAARDHGTSCVSLARSGVGREARAPYAVPGFRPGFFGFLFGDQWTAGRARGDAPVSEFTGTYGAMPFIFGTLYTSAIAVALALPMAIAVSFFINFFRITDFFTNFFRITSFFRNFCYSRKRCTFSC